MKKILAMALALLFVAALFTGCSKKAESPSEPILVVRVLIERFIERQCGFNVFRPDMDDDRFF